MVGAHTAVPVEKHARVAVYLLELQVGTPDGEGGGSDEEDISGSQRRQLVEEVRAAGP